eukprot:5459121-Alexandrium_andersonii.AAC.1
MPCSPSRPARARRPCPELGVGGSQRPRGFGAACRERRASRSAPNERVADFTFSERWTRTSRLAHL